MTDSNLGSIERLGDTNLQLADSAQDLRGRAVIDGHGDKIGTVTAVFADKRDRKVRFLEVAAGGFLGMGQDHVLIPVYAITSVGPNEVHIEQTKDKLAGALAYDPAVVPTVGSAESQPEADAGNPENGSLPE